jgi:8-oxo-dGTP diphosphatase
MPGVAVVRAGRRREVPVKVTAGIIEENGRVLLARRKPGKHMGGKWEFPGGKIEPGESPEQSLARELNEELCVRAQIGKFLCTTFFEGDGVSLELLVYRVDCIEGAPELREHDEIRWVRPDQLPSFDLADSDRMVVEALYRRGREA